MSPKQMMKTKTTWTELATLILKDPSNRSIKNLKDKIDKYYEDLET